MHDVGFLTLNEPIAGFSGDGTRSGCRKLTCDTGFCYPGARCTDRPDGPKCGPCPAGMTGDGTSQGCRKIACPDGPCYPGVPCSDSPNGATCGPCPEGMEGDGTRNGCKQMESGCAKKPCYQGVTCKDTPRGPVCGPCPEGSTGNGIECYDVNEVILLFTLYIMFHTWHILCLVEQSRHVVDGNVSSPDGTFVWWELIIVHVVSAI